VPTPTRPPATSPPPSSGQAVGIANFAYTPSSITVRVGTRVTWTNRQAAIQHTVTADDGSFGSGQLSTGVSFSHVFTTAGTYSYHCSIHPDMTGTVTVTG
jgi:plastocyanin